jgi:hypothetical protein
MRLAVDFLSVTVGANDGVGRKKTESNVGLSVLTNASLVWRRMGQTEMETKSI